MHSFVVQNLPEFIKANPLPTAKNPPMTEPIRAPHKEWDAVYHAAAQLDPLACCLVELCDRVVALETAGSVAGNSGHASESPAGVTMNCLPPISPAVWVGTPADVAPQVVPTTPAAAPSGGVTAEELVDCLPKRWNGSFEAFARHLLDHPRIGPLLRGEGAPVPKRVVLPEKPPMTGLYWVSHDYRDGYRDCWAAARAEVERQQQGGQADG